MKPVYSFRTGLEAHDLRLFLESHGIEAKVFGDNNAFEVGFAFTPASSPAVFVDYDDFAEAQLLTEQFLARTDRPATAVKWRCPCGEANEPAFDICWKCGALRDDAQAQDSVPEQADIKVQTGTGEESICTQVGEVTNTLPALEVGRPKWKLWIEILTVIAVYPPFFHWRDVIVSWSPQAIDNWRLSHWYIEFAAINVVSLAIVFVIIRQSGEGLAQFGLQPFNLLWDLVSGWFLTVVMVMVLYIAADSFGHFLHAFPTLNEYLDFNYGEYDYPAGIYGLFVLGIAAICIALSEEIAFRGFLITRLEQVFDSTRWAVVLSAFLFGSIHVGQNLMGMWQAFVFGLITGAVFVRHRRIWPLVVAHATIDYLVFLRDGR